MRQSKDKLLPESPLYLHKKSVGTWGLRLSQERTQEIKREQMELGDMMRAGALAEGMVSE